MRISRTGWQAMAVAAGLALAADAPCAAAPARPVPTVAPIVRVGPGEVSTTEPLVVRTRPPGSTPVAARPTPPARSTPTPTPRPRPTATPAPTPTPTPAPRPFYYRYSPPLSPEDALTLVRQDCRNILLINDPSTLAARCRKVSEIIVATTRYLNILDQRHSTLASYKWYFIDREKVDPGIDVDVFRARPVIPNVSAVSFRAHYGDVYVYWATVRDAEGKPTTFTLRHLVEQDYPQEEICYLFFPTTLREVVVKYEAKRYRSREPRITVLAGVAGQQEYLKQALWYLHAARSEVNLAMSRPAEAGPQIQAALENLRRAAERLVQFRMKRR